MDGRLRRNGAGKARSGRHRLKGASTYAKIGMCRQELRKGDANRPGHGSALIGDRERTALARLWDKPVEEAHATLLIVRGAARLAAAAAATQQYNGKQRGSAEQKRQRSAQWGHTQAS